MDEILKDEVRHRAQGRCEYCRLPQAFYPILFHIEHIIARKHGGSDSLDNLALACYRCNLYKGPNLSGIDPVSGKMERLFHPRRDAWFDHFAWSGLELAGLTSVARATLAVLNINHSDAIALRGSLLVEGVDFIGP